MCVVLKVLLPSVPRILTLRSEQPTSAKVLRGLFPLECQYIPLCLQFITFLYFIFVQDWTFVQNFATFGTLFFYTALLMQALFYKIFSDIFSMTHTFQKYCNEHIIFNRVHFLDTASNYCLWLITQLSSHLTFQHWWEKSVWAGQLKQVGFIYSHGQGHNWSTLSIKLKKIFSMFITVNLRMCSFCRVAHV